MLQFFKNIFMNRKYQLGYSDSKPSMYKEDERIKKANKTVAILKDYLNEISTLDLLDIGSSTGIMTNEYAKYFKYVTGVDLDTKGIQYSTNRYKRNNLKFICSPIEEIDISDSSFDVITCSQIYEHVPSDKKLMEEILRLLKPGGICYFAAVNKFKIIEPHYQLPFLSFLPKSSLNLALAD